MPGGRPSRDRDHGRGRDFRDAGHGRARVESPAGVRLEIQPLHAAVDALAREIIRSARCYPLFDVIRVLLAGRDRYRAVFTAAPETGRDGAGADAGPGVTLILDKATPALWLDRSEAVRQLWQAPWRERFYREEVVETDPPKGNFAGVARCTMSGEWLGPPNHHAYQDNLLRLHRERFAHMPLEDYRRRVRVERDEAMIQEWRDQMRLRRVWHPLTGGQRAVDEASEHPAEKPEEEPAPKGDAAPEAPPTEDPSAPSDQSAPSKPAALTEPQQVERHFLEHHFGRVYRQVRRAVVPGDVAARQLSPGLLTLLADTLSQLRRHPRDLIGPVQSALARRHLHVFRWDNRLHVALARPNPLPEDANLAERPARILEALRSGRARTLKELWQLLARGPQPVEPARATEPAEPTGPDEPAESAKTAGPAASSAEETPAGTTGQPSTDAPAAPAAAEATPAGPAAVWLADLHWLLTQGHVLLLADNRLIVPSARPGSGPRDRSGEPATADPESAPRRRRSRRRQPRDPQ